MRRGQFRKALRKGRNEPAGKERSRQREGTKLVVNAWCVHEIRRPLWMLGEGERLGRVAELEFGEEESSCH